jgi:acyl dehydratase
VYRIKARNVSSTGENAIHDDDTARRYGFRGALVPGVMIYAYMTQPLAAAFGAAWLMRGTASVRFVKPVLDAEELVVQGALHPGFYLEQANRALDRNVKMGPWIHVGSVVRHLGGARVGDRLATRGKVRSVFEKKGREFVELDLVIVAGETARPVAHVLHTAVYHLPSPA